MKITYIMPCIGKKKGRYLKGWKMEPLSIAVLSALTPAEIEQNFYDDRLEAIPYDEPTDLVAVSVETYTAQRAYQIAAEYKRRSVPVIMGGFHPTLMPDEVLEHADAVVIGEAEGVWQGVIADTKTGRLRRKYQSSQRPLLKDIKVNRDIYGTKKYLNLSLVETGRGCNFNCEFCSITNFYNKSHRVRPIADVVYEIKTLKNRNIFFVDDNIGADLHHAKKLFQALVPLKIRWTCQVTINIAQDESLLSLMKKSGCIGVLIGFESLNPESLGRIGKKVNKDGLTYEKNLNRLRKYGIAVYSTFIFGYDNDTLDCFQRTLEFSQKQKFFLSAFNHLVPFPGTALYKRLKAEERLFREDWWLSEEYCFGDVAFRPINMTPDELSILCFTYRRKFYEFKSIAKRAFDYQANCRSPYMALLYFIQNFFNAGEVRKRQGLPLGIKKDRTSTFKGIK